MPGLNRRVWGRQLEEDRTQCNGDRPEAPPAGTGSESGALAAPRGLV